MDLLGNGQGFGAPLGFQDALVLTPGTAACIRRGVGRVLAAEHAARQRAERHNAQAIMRRRLELLGFGLAIDDVVQRLADHRFRHAQTLGQVADFGNTPATEVGHAPVTDFALADQVANGGNAHFQRGVVVFAVQVVDVQVIGAQARQAGLDRIEDVLAAQTAAVGHAVSRTKADLGRQHPFMAVAGNRFADDLFTAPGAVHVCGVNEVDALVPGFVDDMQGIFGAGGLAEHHAAQGQGGHLQAAAAQWTVDHDRESLAGWIRSVLHSSSGV
ncbi:hypothetical protein D3C81_1135660 [compost metagenome]